MQAYPQMPNTQVNNQIKSQNTMPIPNVPVPQQNANVPNLNPPQVNLNRSQTTPPQNSGGFFSNWWNNFKSNWITEEEEYHNLIHKLIFQNFKIFLNKLIYIDAHGFKAKRPKKKIPLRNTEKALKNEANFEGGDALSKASQYSPFGRMFL